MLNGERYTKRCHRWNIGGHAHELTFTCYCKRAFLSRDGTRRFLVDAIIAAREKHGFDLWAYVIVPDHVHLVIRPRQDTYSVSQILRSIKQPVSRKAVEYLKRENPEGLRHLATGQQDEPYRFWQKGGGYDRNISRVATLIEVARYVHNNPVRKGLVQRPAEWFWSSAADWEGLGSGPLPIDFDSLPRH